MEDFLLPQGFKPLSLDKVRELVYAKRVGENYSLRIYSTITAGRQKARDCGKDAIRFCLFYRASANDTPRLVNGDKKCLRVEGWRGNMQKRIDAWESMKGVDCPCCAAPMKKRKGNNGEFLGCIQYPDCKGTRNIPTESKKK